MLGVEQEADSGFQIAGDYPAKIPQDVFGDPGRGLRCISARWATLRSEEQGTLRLCVGQSPSLWCPARPGPAVPLQRPGSSSTASEGTADDTQGQDGRMRPFVHAGRT